MTNDSDYAAYIPVVNRPDLLANVVSSIEPVWQELTIIDNSGDGWVLYPPPVKVFRSPVPLSFTQSMNYEFEDASRRGKTFCVHMHSDAVIPNGAIERLLDFARSTNQINQRWGVIYTLYDILCVYNPKVYQDIGGYDTNFAAYFSDQDWYRRLELAGWERINSGIEVGHVGSQTINSDAYLQHVNNVTFPLYREYYRQKWAGEPGHEQYVYPFGVPPQNWKLFTPA